MEINAHRMVANLAVEMAQTVYEGLAKDNTFYKTWTRTAFVKECAPTLRAEAKQLLAGMLTRNDVSQYEKDKIFEALVLDESIPQKGAWDTTQKRI